MGDLRISDVVETTRLSARYWQRRAAMGEIRLSGLMLLTYKYRLNPEKRQHLALERILEQQRQLYNAALEERIEAYRRCGRTISEVDGSARLRAHRLRHDNN